MQSQFNIGNWIRREGYDVSIGKIVEIMPLGGLVTQKYIFDEKDCVLWEPREKEWCWWWNDGDEIPIIRKGYKRIWDNKIVADMGPGKCKEFQYCEPFIGELPSILKKI